MLRKCKYSDTEEWEKNEYYYQREKQCLLNLSKKAFKRHLDKMRHNMLQDLTETMAHTLHKKGGEKK